MMDLGEEEGLRLDTLPAETLLHVLEYLDVKFITETLSQVFILAFDWSIPPDDLDQSKDINSLNLSSGLSSRSASSSGSLPAMTRPGGSGSPGDGQASIQLWRSQPIRDQA